MSKVGRPTEIDAPPEQMKSALLRYFLAKAEDLIRRGKEIKAPKMGELIDALEDIYKVRVSDSTVRRYLADMGFAYPGKDKGSIKLFNQWLMEKLASEATRKKEETRLLKKKEIDIFMLEPLRSAWEQIENKLSKKRETVLRIKYMIYSFYNWVAKYHEKKLHPKYWDKELLLDWKAWITGKGKYKDVTLEEHRVIFPKKTTPPQTSGAFSYLQPIYEIFKILRPIEAAQLSGYTTGTKGEPRHVYLTPEQLPLFVNRLKAVFPKTCFYRVGKGRKAEKKLCDWDEFVAYLYTAIFTGTRIGKKKEDYRKAHGLLSLRLNDMWYEGDTLLFKVKDKGYAGEYTVWTKIALEAQPFIEKVLAKRGVLDNVKMGVYQRREETYYFFETLNTNVIQKLFRVAREIVVGETKQGVKDLLFVDAVYCPKCDATIYGLTKERFILYEENLVEDLGDSIVMSCPECGELVYLGLPPREYKAKKADVAAIAITPHVLRKTGATWFIVFYELPPHVTAELLGWKDLNTMKKHYVIVEKEYLKREVEKGIQKWKEKYPEIAKKALLVS